MFGQNKSRYKNLYKKLRRIRENLFQRDKVLSFKKKKWSRFKFFYKIRTREYRGKPYWYINKKYYSIKSPLKYVIRYKAYGPRFKKNIFRDIMLSALKFRLYYGGFTKRQFKSLLKEAVRSFNRQKKFDLQGSRQLNAVVLERFERRLDAVLFKAKFAFSAKSAKQMILHGKISVNGRITRSRSFLLKEGDLVEVKPSFKNCLLVLHNMKESKIWPAPPKHLIINYRTMQIIFGNIEHTWLGLGFHTFLPVNKVINYIKR